MTTYVPPRPWITSYAEGVPEDLAPVTGSLVDIVAASAHDHPDAPRCSSSGARPPNVAPTEVEIALRQHPQVDEAAVVGLPSDHSGEEVVAAVVLAPGADAPDIEGIREFVRGILTPYKVPRRIFVVDELPKSLIGKVMRRQLRDSLLQLTTGR